MTLTGVAAALAAAVVLTAHGLGWLHRAGSPVPVRVHHPGAGR